MQTATNFLEFVLLSPLLSTQLYLNLHNYAGVLNIQYIIGQNMALVHVVHVT